MTKTHFIELWARLTGEPEKEALYRARVLSEEGLLPRRQKPFNGTHLARWLIAVLAAPSPSAACATVRRFSDMRAFAGEGEDAAAFFKFRLIDAIEKANSAPYTTLRLRGSNTASGFNLTFVRGAAEVTIGRVIGDPSYVSGGKNTELRFGDQTELPCATLPVQTWNETNFALVSQLVQLVSQTTENQSAASVDAEAALDNPTALAGHEDGAERRRHAIDSKGDLQPPIRPTGDCPIPTKRIRQKDPAWPKSNLPRSLGA